MLGDKPENAISDFFRSNLVTLRKAVLPSDLKKFAALKSNGERVAFILGYPEAHCLPLDVEHNRNKDLEKALKLKDAGNKFFGMGHYLRALENYSNAVLLAPRKDLGIILANRSAALSSMGRHDLAISDVEECLRVGYPEELRFKVEERRARCLLAMEDHARAIESFRRTLRALENAKIPLQRRQKMESDVRLMLAVMEKGSELIQADKKSAKHERPAVVRAKQNAHNETETKTIPRMTDINPLYPSCSKAVEIRDDGGVIGRRAIATRDIAPGELLLVERPHSAILLGEYRLSHCQMCFAKNVAPYPPACDSCDSVAYCSVRCRDAHATVHINECQILPVLWLSQASVTCLMALKSVAQCPFIELCKMKTDIENGNYDISESRPYRPRDYLALHGLITHEKERVAEDLFHRAYMAAWLFRLLKKTNYFPENIESPNGEQHLTTDEQFIAGLLLHNLQLLPFNAHEISELTRKKGEKKLTEAKSTFIGGGIYPTVALFNHSCNPGIIRYFIGPVMVVRAARTITAGSEICENYGPIFTMTEEAERKRRLRLRYWFDCGCEACVGHWPLLQSIDPRILRFKCDTGPSCGNVLPVNTDSNEFFVIPCSKCGKSTNIFKGLKALQDTDALFKVATRHLDENAYEKALKAYLDILKLLDETLALPIKDYHMCQQGVRLCMLTFGNMSVM